MGVVAFYVWGPKKFSPVFLCVMSTRRSMLVKSSLFFLKDFKSSVRNCLVLETNKLPITAINNLIGVVVVGLERQEHELCIFLGLSKDERRTASIMRHCCTN